LRAGGRTLAVQRMAEGKAGDDGEFARGGRHGDLLPLDVARCFAGSSVCGLRYWHTSPNFFLTRVAILLAVMFFAYAWCRWGAEQWGFSPLIEMGQASLLVYWVHIEFVYGRLSIMRKGTQTIPAASAGLAVIFVAMVLLAMARTRWKGRGLEFLGWLRRVSRAVTEA